MKAMIFAAGLGTRLQPFTHNIPKALVPVNGVPLLEIQIRKLLDFGVEEIIVNVHHFADQVKGVLKLNNDFGARIEVSDESDQLLDTGGGVAKAAWFFKGEENFILHNVDVVSGADLTQLSGLHNQCKALATLAVRKRKSSRYLIFDEDQRLSGWKNTKTGDEIISRKTETKNLLAFSGIHIINTRIFDLIPATGKFSIIQSYLSLSADNLIVGWENNDSYWFDVGTPEKLQDVEKYLQS